MTRSYPADVHRAHSDMTDQSARLVMAHLMPIFEVGSIVEIGCGNAHWTRAGLELGASDHLVADGPWTDLSDLLVSADRFVPVDLTRPLALGRRFDLAICLEVAEHVPSDHAESLIDGLAGTADVVLFGAAIPYQGGYGHINEQRPSWWRDKFVRRGFAPYDLVRPKFWENASVHYWYRQNAFVYVSTSNGRATERAAAAERELRASPALFDAVLPERFEEVASYRSLSLKRFARRLPSAFALRLKQRIGLG